MGSPPDMFSRREDLVAVGLPLAVDKLAQAGEVVLPELWLQSGEPRLEHLEADCYKPILLLSYRILIAKCQIGTIEQNLPQPFLKVLFWPLRQGQHPLVR